MPLCPAATSRHAKRHGRVPRPPDSPTRAAISQVSMTGSSTSQKMRISMTLVIRKHAEDMDPNHGLSRTYDFKSKQTLVMRGNEWLPQTHQRAKMRSGMKTRPCAPMAISLGEVVKVNCLNCSAQSKRLIVCDLEKTVGVFLF